MMLMSLDMAITKVLSKFGSSFLHCLLPYSNILQYCAIFGPQWRRSEQAVMHGKRNFLSILLDCMQVVHAGRQKCFWLCREKLVSFVVQTKHFVLNQMQTVLLGFWEEVSFVVQNKIILFWTNADCVVRVLLTSFIWLVGTIHQCCSWKNLPPPTRLATYLAMSSTRLSYAD